MGGVDEDGFEVMMIESCGKGWTLLKPNPFEPTHGPSRKQCMNEPEYDLQNDEIVSLHTDHHAHSGVHGYRVYH